MEWKGLRGTVLRDISMKRYTSMKVGGRAAYLVYPADEDDLRRTLRSFQTEGMKYRVFGNGTNVIVDDRGINEALVRITRMKHTRYVKTGCGVSAQVSGGMSLRAFIRDCAEKGLSGLEKLYGIPGTVGGGIKMNAGSFGRHISDTLEECTVSDARGSLMTIAKNDMHFGYRTSCLKTTECVVSARFALTIKDRQEIQDDMNYVYGERKKRHPMDYPSAGSIFKSVAGVPAWKYIEEAGLKGFSIGGAAISDKHANFIINLGFASARDIYDLACRVKKEVFEKLGVVLTEEVEFWGFNG